MRRCVCSFDDPYSLWWKDLAQVATLFMLPRSGKTESPKPSCNDKHGRDYQCDTAAHLHGLIQCSSFSELVDQSGLEWCVRVTCRAKRFFGI